jgi:hypothetical protein
VNVALVFPEGSQQKRERLYEEKTAEERAVIRGENSRRESGYTRRKETNPCVKRQFVADR